MTPEQWERLGALYEEASALGECERAAFLQNACRDDVAVRQELESLLASDGAATGFLGEGALTEAARMLAADASVSLAGKDLAHYRVLSLLGSGGMGDVYRARDSRLGRDVAIKTIPGIIMPNEHARRRFEEEARAIALLSHPNVRALYDIGEVEGRLYAVLELLEGETLRERLGRGPLPVRKALEIGAAMAEGLAAAHNKGIVHRDLKPENVFLTSDGHVKVLDFGLATIPLAHDGNPPAESLAQSHMVCGTVGYMSPEQVAQKNVDARSDLFSLGCVLFEMVSGRRLFQRETATATMAAIVTDEPVELESLGADLGRILLRCLEKKPEARFQSAHDLAFHLRSVAQSATESAAGAVIGAARWRRRTVWFGAAAAGIAATFLGLTMARRLEPSPLQSYLLPPTNTELCDDCGIALSPDGRRIAFVAGGAGGALPSLWVQSLSESSARQIAGTQGARFPFWSPDGRWIGFFSGGSLMSVDADGDSPRIVCTPCSGQGTWNTEGTIVFGQVNNPLRAVPASGGTPVPVTELDRTRANEGHTHPVFLPGGRRLLFRNIANNDPDARGIYAASLDSPAITLVRRVHGISTPHSKALVAAGHLLFVQEDTLMAVPFDATRLRVEGEPKPIAPTTGPFAVTGSELLVYGQRPLFQLAWVDRQGRETTLPFTGDFFAPVLSHDGQRVAVVKMAEDGRAAGDVWVYDVTRNVPMRLTTSPEHDVQPVWSPDDEWVLFSSDRRGRWDQFRKRSSGAGGEEILSFGAFDGMAHSWSRDGQSLIGHDVRAAGDLWRLSFMNGASPLFKSPTREWAGQLSPRGDYLAYISDETGQAEIYVQTFPLSTQRWRVSSAGGLWPRWRGDGRELFFTDTATRMLMAVEFMPGSPSPVGVPKPLFSKSFVHARQWLDVAADGQRFLVIKALADATPGKLTLLQNWTAKLKQ